jgi:hypothetical protein
MRFLRMKGSGLNLSINPKGEMLRTIARRLLVQVDDDAVIRRLRERG